ncbi:hypothetical protein AGR5A_Cc190058 [Agrobacterium genomosp. 5 str. CFBP 6626]|nr:hypothetical protein AGR5A_Cc190058 [Agrobacterium genomosp. 5 str. CFBP 6626]
METEDAFSRHAGAQLAALFVKDGLTR